MFKKSTLAIMGLTCSSFAFSGTMGPVCTPGNVTVPCLESKWDLGVQALYLKTVFDADKGYRYVVPPLFGYERIQTDWNWGFRLEGSYHFNTGNDVSLNWSHYKSDFEQNNLAIINPFTGLTPFNLISQNNFDQVNLVLGQHVDFGLVKKMRFYGGLQYVHLINDDSDNFRAGTLPPFIPTVISSLSQFDNSDFKGLGPVVGIDYSYHLTPAFSVTANGSGSLLIGTSRYSGGIVGLPVQLVLLEVDASKRAIVPSLEAKLGLNYAYNIADGILNLEGGYQALNYFNVIQTQGINGVVSSAILNSDFGLYGPYLGLKYLGNA